MQVVPISRPNKTSWAAMASLVRELSVFLCFLICISELYPVQSSASNPVFACGNPASGNYSFCNPSLGIRSRVEDLVKRLTLQEKVRFLGNAADGIPRLDIPKYEWWSEALHGVSYVGPGTKFSSLVPGATSFPQVILTAASFNTSLFEAIGTAVSTEARAMYNVGLAGLTYWSPNVNIFRDPRWGRGQETPGEDPLLSSKYASSYVRALQETHPDNPDRLKVAACCKHYTAYDLDNWNKTDRFHFDAVVTQQDMDDTFQPPFRSCVLDGNVASVMCSYNKLNGKPTCADPDLLAGVIRTEWKLNGYIVSDCDSVEVFFNTQHYTNTPEEAAAKALLAGLDLNCGSFLQKHTESAVKSGLVTEAEVDKAIYNNFATLMRLGFFNGDPSNKNNPYGTLGAKHVCTQEHQELAIEAARQGIVLLKNEPGSLPLSKSTIKSLAVIGPNANASKTMIGNYEGNPCRYTTPLQGLSAVVPTTYHPGCSISCRTPQIDECKKIAADAEATILVVGTDQSVEAEGLDRVDLNLPGQQALLVNEVASASKGLVILVIMSGGGLDVSFAKSNPRISSILWVGFPGEAGGSAIADVIFGDYNPSGRLPMTWYPQSYVETVPMTIMNMRPDSSTGYPGRTYRFYSGETVFEFGYGLSYSDFKHRLVRAAELVSVPLDEAHVCRSSDCQSFDAVDPRCSGVVYHLHLNVRNRGASGGSHTVLLFSTPPSKHNSPRKQLLGFERMYLAAKEEKVVRFKLDVCRDLSVVDEVGKKKLLLGPHVLHVGNMKHSLNLTI